MGILFNSEEAKKLLKHIRSSEWPAFAVFRKNLFDQTELLSGININTHNPDP